MTPKDVQDFINTWNGKKLDTDGYPSYNKYQCVDVIRKYLPDVVKCPLVGGNAIDYWYYYPYNKTLQKYFVRIPNSWTFIPKLGDICIFGPVNGNPYGHIGLGTNAGNLLYATVFEQNDPVGSGCHYKAYNISVAYYWPKLLGVLRPRALA